MKETPRARRKKTANLTANYIKTLILTHTHEQTHTLKNSPNEHQLIHVDDCDCCVPNTVYIYESK